jgi:hypothetical protein
MEVITRRGRGTTQYSPSRLDKIFGAMCWQQLRLVFCVNVLMTERRVADERKGVKKKSRLLRGLQNLVFACRPFCCYGEIQA